MSGSPNVLQQRAKDFLDWPIPQEMNYIEGSLAEAFIARYAQTGSLKADSELMEMLQIIVAESPIIDGAQPGSEQAYLNESGVILREILRQLSDN